MSESTPEPQPEEVDPNFIPENAPRFIPYPIEPSMGAKGPTSQGLIDLGSGPDEEVGEDGDSS